MNRRAIGFESWPISLFGESSAGANHVRNASCAPILRAPRVRGTADAVRAFEPGFFLTHDGRFESVVCTRDFRVSSQALPSCHTGPRGRGTTVESHDGMAFRARQETVSGTR